MTWTRMVCSRNINKIFSFFGFRNFAFNTVCHVINAITALILLNPLVLPWHHCSTPLCLTAWGYYIFSLLLTYVYVIYISMYKWVVLKKDETTIYKTWCSSLGYWVRYGGWLVGYVLWPAGCTLLELQHATSHYWPWVLHLTCKIFISFKCNPPPLIL